MIDETADIEMAVSSIILSKTFDNGVICASEQSVIVVDTVYDAVKAEFIRRGGHFFTEAEKVKAREKIQVDGKLNPNIVGQSVAQLAELFGISSTVPAGTRVLLGEVSEIGHHEALSIEKLCPVLAFYRASDYKVAVEMADKLVRFGGPGHTSVLYTNPGNKAAIDLFSGTINTARILVNCPASQGAIGDLYNFHLDPS